tara:strand:- start:22 stop:228 length:207 start_codon:yes stop_codon:yes gene_type:complete
MAKYKATEDFKNLEKKYFGVHKVKNLESGGTIEITCIELVPKEVQKCLVPIDNKKKKKVSKDTKKKEK